tara:strand:- start:150 stop:335 length:186 start_codon:yes stop_codon:yes gene_type:complete
MFPRLNKKLQHRSGSNASPVNHGKSVITDNEGAKATSSLDGSPKQKSDSNFAIKLGQARLS